MTSGQMITALVTSPPGEAPLREADLKPFAGLAKLMEGKEKS